MTHSQSPGELSGMALEAGYPYDGQCLNERQIGAFRLGIENATP
jgi:hypothetical protein